MVNFSSQYRTSLFIFSEPLVHEMNAVWSAYLSAE